MTDVMARPVRGDELDLEDLIVARFEEEEDTWDDKDTEWEEEDDWDDDEEWDEDEDDWDDDDEEWGEDEDWEDEEEA